MRTFSLFIHSAASIVPMLLIDVFDDEAGARELAERALAESPGRLLAEVRENDRLLFSVDRNGVTWIAHETGV